MSPTVRLRSRRQTTGPQRSTRLLKRQGERPRVAKMEASAQTKREAAEKVEADHEAAERAEREAAEQVIREVDEPAKGEVAAKPESGVSDGPSFTDGIRPK